MNIHIHIHHHNDSQMVAFDRIFSLLNKIKMDQAELLFALEEANAKIDKIVTEVTENDAAQESKIASLEAKLAEAGVLSPEIQAAVDALKVKLQKADDATPDAASGNGEGSGVHDGV